MQNNEDKLLMEKDAINNERLRWSFHRDKKLRPETVELDEKLERLDPDRFAAYQKLEDQVSLIVSKVHFDRFGKIEGRVLSNSDELNGLQKNVDTLKEILRGWQQPFFMLKLYYVYWTKISINRIITITTV